MKIVIIGAGVMGSAYARAWISHKLVAPTHLTVCDPDTKKLARLRQKLKVRVSSDNAAVAKNANVILLAVKPQQMYSVLDELKRSLHNNQLVISIAAGVNARSIEKVLKNRQPVVRAMPNLPLTVGAGVTTWCANGYVTAIKLRMAERLLSAGAVIVKVPERNLDAVTAISGSGPGYVFAFADALIKAARHLDLPPNVADILVRNTLFGAGKILQGSKDAPATLAQRVASKGGTTEAALQVLNRNKFNTIIQQAMRAAVKRAKELRI